MGGVKNGVENEPFSAGISGNLAMAYYLARRDGQAIEQSLKALEIGPNSFDTHLVLGSAYREEGSYREAIVELQEAAKLSHDNRRALATLAYTYAVSGKKEETRAILRQLRTEAKQHYGSPFHLAFVYGALGGNDRSFVMLTQA